MKSSIATLSLLAALAACSESEPKNPPQDGDSSTPGKAPHNGPNNAPNNEQEPDQPAVQQPATDPTRADQGRILFAVSPGNCAKCHTPDATGSDRAPNLTTGNFSHSDGSIQGIQQVIIAGVSKDELSSQEYPFAMNPRGNSNLTDQQCLDLAHYVKSLSQ